MFQRGFTQLLIARHRHDLVGSFLGRGGGQRRLPQTHFRAGLALLNRRTIPRYWGCGDVNISGFIGQVVGLGQAGFGRF